MKKTILFFVAIATLTLISCNRQEENLEPSSTELSLENKKKVEVMKDFSKLLGKTLVEKQNREYIESLIKDRNDNSEAITVNALLGKKIPTQENRLLQRSKNTKKSFQTNSFREAIIKELKNNLKEYPSLQSELKKNKSNSVASRSSDEIYDDLSDYFVEQGLDVYFPYEENFVLADESKITVTWDPMTGQDTNSGYVAMVKDVQIARNSSTSRIGLQELTPIDNISDDYAYQNATLVVRPATWIDGGIITDPNPNPTVTANNPPDWSFQGWQGFLTFNVDHTKIKDEDILKVNIPKIRLMEHLGTFLTPTTITLVRSSANLTTDNNNLLIFPLTADSRQLLYRHHVKRRDARNHNWVDVNVLWDDDWNMHEAEHTLTWASHHTFSWSLDATGTVKLGWDAEKKKVTYDPKIDINFKVRVGGNCRMEYNNNVSRRAVLTQVIGDTGAGTYNDGGTNYSVRTAGKMQYYFKPYLTKIVQ